MGELGMKVPDLVSSYRRRLEATRFGRGDAAGVHRHRRTQPAPVLSHHRPKSDSPVHSCRHPPPPHGTAGVHHRRRTQQALSRARSGPCEAGSGHGRQHGALPCLCTEDSAA
ncbi:hypothetical protein C2845_PM14G08590 [Panicum miliaceum]|uniref:Uncharacterized protein n=1 Tax=Panicum miliaceum TaxID=4540 RepID=A0A3L6PPD9_PANMI|nr:hypothetical protein C2845_PM14G08590 [Panicum miliaceum]